MAAGEVENVAHRFLTSLGRGTEWDPEDFDSVAAVIQAFKFGIFLTIIESKYAKDVDEGGLKESVTDIHDYFVIDAIKKVVTIYFQISVTEIRLNASDVFYIFYPFDSQSITINY